MIDTNSLNEEIAKRVAEAVNLQVADIFKNDPQLLEQIKNHAVAAFVRRITMDDDLSSIITEKVAEQMQLFTNDEEMLNKLESNTIAALVQKFNQENDTNSFVQNKIEKHIESLFGPDTEMLAGTKVHAITKLAQQLNSNNRIEGAVANKITENLKPSIYVDARDRELSVLDENVVVENTLVARNVNAVEQLAGKNATFSGKLIVTGSVDPNTGAWDDLIGVVHDKVTTQVSDILKQEMIDGVIAESDNINHTQILLDGKPALIENRIGKQITQSNLQKVGVLENLNVKGEVTLADDTLYASGKRVGINTTAPGMALDIWDGEVQIVAGKHEAQTAFVGTARAQTLKIGVNNTGHITVTNDGTVRVEKFKIGDRTIAFAGGTPSYAGKPGDVVFNTSVTRENPIFCWMCVHDFSWLPLRANV